MKGLPAFVLILFLLAPPTRSLGGTDTLSAVLDGVVAEQMREKDLVGVSLAIMQEGRMVLAKGYGVKSLAGNAPVATNTLFAIGSVTKQFTCAAILLLAEDGKLSTLDPVGKYFPQLTAAGRITLLDLMNHVSGYPDYYPLDFIDSRMEKPISPEVMLRDYASGKLDFEPGSNYSYSNTGYYILGLVVERVSGLPMGEFLQRRIFGPLGMKDTIYDPKPAGERFATGYRSFGLARREPAPPEAEGWLAAAGAIYSTPTDLLLWDLALMDGKLLKPESWKLMTSPRMLSDGRESNYGCGLGIGQRNGRKTLGHTGAVSGFIAGNTMVPSNRTAVVVLVNTEGAGGELRSKVLDLVLTEPSRVPQITGASAREAALALLKQLQRGKVDRSKLGAEFSRYLTEDRIKATVNSLRGLGRPNSVEVTSLAERGGLEVSTVRFTFKQRAFQALMYRSTDGLVQEYLLQR